MKLSCKEFMTLYKKVSPDKRVLLDVREPSECAAGMLEGSINIPVSELESRFAEIPADKEIFIYCRMGGRAERAEMFLMHRGVKDTRVAAPGGYDELKKLA